MEGFRVDSGPNAVVALKGILQGASPLFCDMKVHLSFASPHGRGFTEMLGDAAFSGQLIERGVQGIVKIFSPPDLLDLILDLDTIGIIIEPPDCHHDQFFQFCQFFHAKFPLHR